MRLAIAAPISPPLRRLVPANDPGQGRPTGDRRPQYREGAGDMHEHTNGPLADHNVTRDYLPLSPDIEDLPRHRRSLDEGRLR